MALPRLFTRTIQVADRQITLTDDQIDRFRARIDDTGYCWPWVGRLDRDGYGIFTVKRNGFNNIVAAHRVAFILANGPIRDGLQVDHVCRNRACVRPEHLDLVTSRTNTMRSPIAPASVNAAKTHCKNGHLLGAPTVAGGRPCHPCRTAANARYRARKAARPPIPTR